MSKPFYAGPDTLASRVLDLLESRAAWCNGRVAFSFLEMADLIYSRHPGDGRPTKREIKQAVQGLGVWVKVVNGKVVYRGE